MVDIFIGRQPILDAGSQLFAYELLCRTGPDNSAPEDLDGDRASATVVLNAFMEVGLENVVGRHPALVRMTRLFLTDELYRPLPRSRVILSVPGDMVLDTALERAIREAREAGYKIALGRFVYREESEPLIALADFVKVDVSRLDEQQIRSNVLRLRRPGLTLIAEHVEERAQFIVCQSAGFRYFKGYYFCRPDVVKHSTVPASKVAVMQLVARVRDPNVSLKEIQEIIERNVSLSFRILRTVNSALYALPRRIESVRHAIALLGLDRIRACLSLSLLAGLDDKPHELSVTSLVRARTCQLLARATGSAREEVFFSAGLLSTLDAILDRPMAVVLDMIPLAAELRDAIHKHQGPAGVALRAALSCEREVPDLMAVQRFGVDAIHEAYVSAIRWVAELDEALGETPQGQPALTGAAGDPPPPPSR